MGGMGNQMFQYALGRNLSLRYEIPLKLDLSFLRNRNMGSNFVYRDYDLDIFNVYSDFDLKKVQKVIRITEPHFHYSENISIEVEKSLKIGDSILIEGYWQSPLYFEENKAQIREDFKFKDDIEKSNDATKKMLNSIKNSNSVLINVRRTDYLNTSFHGVMGLDYISEAKLIIEQKVKDPHYFIFSDDIDWCIENIKIDNMTIVDHSFKGNKFANYLQLMSNCKNFIIPNSSFAWWSAWLNTNSAKIVIAPKKWFTDSSINTKDLIPQDWIRI